MSARPDGSHASRIAAIRARLLALAAAHAHGELEAGGYESARREAERELGEAVIAAPPELIIPGATPSATPATRPSARLVAALIAVVLVVAIGGYAFTGSPSFARLGASFEPSSAPAAAAAGPATDADKARAIDLQQVAEMVDKLAARMKERPDDAEGWTMLARSYAVLGRFPEAVPAYRHAMQLQRQNAGLMADYADALAGANGGRITPESMTLVDRALAIDQKQPKALALAGTIAFDRGDYAGAVAQWQKIVDAQPGESDFLRQVRANIDEARLRGRVAATSPSAGDRTPESASAVASTGKAGTKLDAAELGVTGTVTLAPALAARAAPTDAVFVFARPVEGGRMPLAVLRATVADLPLRFRLDDSMAMTPALKLSNAKQVIVGARVSKSGNAIAQAGDLAGESAPLAPGASGLSIVISGVVDAK